MSQPSNCPLCGGAAEQNDHTDEVTHYKDSYTYVGMSCPLRLVKAGSAQWEMMCELMRDGKAVSDLSAAWRPVVSMDGCGQFYYSDDGTERDHGPYGKLQEAIDRGKEKRIIKGNPE